MVRRDFQSRFIGSVGGWLWGIVHPVVTLACWTFVFQWCLRQPVPPDAPTQNYTMFLFCGYLPWLLFQETMSRGSNCLVDHANLITKTVFPSEVIPISIFLSALLSHLMALTIVMLACILWLGQISGFVVFLPIYMFLIGLFAIGLSWITSSLQVYLRDTNQVVSVILTFWFWTTPVFISEEQVPDFVRPLIHYNPLSFLVTAYRNHLLSYRLPDLHDLAILTAFAVTTFFVGGLFFRQLKRGFADVL